MPHTDKLKWFLLFTVFAISTGSIAQKKDDATIAKMITEFKADVRGPYKDIRWFCKDGSFVEPKSICPNGGNQRARYKDNVVALGKSNHVYLGQILSTTSIEAFWDKDYNQSRLKQYQLEQYLKGVDNGWVNRKAQYYRGAYQAEDEQAWGIEFFLWALTDTNKIRSNYFLLRQSAKDIPHAADNNTAQKVRAISKEISDVFIQFMDLRVKLHGQPDEGDIQRVKDFRAKYKTKMPVEVDQKFTLLLNEMVILYRPLDINDFKAFVKKLPTESVAAKSLNEFIAGYSKATSAKERTELISTHALVLRVEMMTPIKPSARLALIDASNRMETLLNRVSPEWKPQQLDEQMLKVHLLAQASAGFGYVEQWEWEQLKANFDKPITDEQISLTALSLYLENAQRSVEWGTAMIRATYQDVIKFYSGFEPLAYGLIDDKARASVLLHLGSSVSILGDFFSREAGFSNKVMGIADQSTLRGLNQGYALGELVVTNQSPEEVEVDGSKIYVFNRPPADLKPVAGIATVTEGNMVSHVQLLARNLGIPNAVLSMDNLMALLPFSGQRVFYAVSNKGTVIMKPEQEMTAEEIALFAIKERSDEKITVPVDEMELSDTQILNIRDVNATHSGKSCGPKAANLGQLKLLFPEQVVEGLVIPFSIFRQHFDQPMPGQQESYWEYLNAVFANAEDMRLQEKTEAEIEKYVLGGLSVLRDAIKTMPLRQDFQDELLQKFIEVFDKEMGTVPVFLRSDTNMEDLKDFTGAGLNLTLFNVLDPDKIFQGIRDVWASPYTERSYKWRQRYLLNPENVFPSILIIPSVDADCSGVMITKGVATGKEDDITVAFNRGVGGAVEGQASESWLLRDEMDNNLITPAREPEYTSIPATGGTKKQHTTFEKRLLSTSKLEALSSMADYMKEKLPASGMKSPYDVELGFKNEKIWLFQVRPFVENKRAASSEYLRSITPELNTDLLIPLNTRL